MSTGTMIPRRLNFVRSCLRWFYSTVPFTWMKGATEGRGSFLGC